jgi:hypothetical protein
MQKFTRREVLGGVAASAFVLSMPYVARAAGPKTLKISHQFPGGTIDEGDFRDRLCRKFAAEVEKRTNGAVRVDVYPNSSLMKTQAQFSALRKGALDLSLYPLAYAGGEVPETNLSTDSLVGQRMAVSFGIEFHDGVMDRAVEVIRTGEGLVSEMMPLQVAPENLDVVQLRSIFRQPLDREPVGARGEGRT